MKATEKATRAVIRSISVDVDRDPLARVAIVLSQRIDADPADDILTRLSRELRLVMAALRDLAGEAGTNDIDAFLAEFAARYPVARGIPANPNMTAVEQVLASGGDERPRTVYEELLDAELAGGKGA